MQAAPTQPRTGRLPDLLAARRPRKRLIALFLLGALGILFTLMPAWRLAPASGYLLLADLPGVPIGPISRVLGTPVVQSWSFAGAEGRVDADVYVPPGGGRHPTLLIVNGALNAGRKYGPLEQFGAALAQVGYTVVIPDYPDLLKEELTPASLSDVEYTLQHLQSAPGVDAGRVELVGFCVGATLGLLAAEDPQMPPMRGVVALSGYISSRDMIQVITTDTYSYQGQLVPYAADPWVVAAVARSLAQGLPDASDRHVFAPFVVDPPPNHYVAPDWSNVPANHLSPGGRALLTLLENRDPARVAALIAALPTPMPQQLQNLSPEAGLARLHTPVFIVADRQDTYIPNIESVKLAAARPDLVHLSYVSILAHVEPTFAAQSNVFATVWDIVSGAWQLFRAIDRALTALN